MESYSHKSPISTVSFLILTAALAILLAVPVRVRADSNEPTATLTPTVTLTASPLPSFTPTLEGPTSTPGPSATQEIAANFEALSQPQGQEESAIQPTPFLQGLSLVNRCLIGAIVMGLSIITLMVVFQVIRRIRPES